MATHHTFTTTYFDNMWDNMQIKFFGGEKLMNIFKSEIKGSKGSVVATHHTFTTTYFDNMWDNMWVQNFIKKKLMNIFDITQKYS